MSLSRFLPILDDLERRKGNDKVRAFGEAIKSPGFEQLVRYAMDPFKMYGIQKLPEYLPQYYQEARIYDILDRLAFNSGTSAADRAQLVCACPDEATWEIVRRIVNKDLRIGVGAKTVVKFLKDFPLHELALCGLQITWTPENTEGEYYENFSDFEKFRKQVGSPSRIMYSNKLDGVRVWATVPRSGKVVYLSRNGKPFKNFGKFDDGLRKFADALAPEGCVYPITFDAEVFSHNKSFNKIMTQISRHGEIDEGVMSMGIFDLPFDIEVLAQRYRLLRRTWEDTSDIWIVPHPYLEVLSGETPLAAVRRVTEEAWANGEEGIVFKDAEAPYSFSRGNDWCKAVTTFSADVMVTGVKKGTGKYAGLLGALTVDFQGTAVDIGSGYDDDERRVFLENPPKMIEVLYRQVTEDGSLRFPRYRRVREDK